jgi:hypothetical protein
MLLSNLINGRHQTNTTRLLADSERLVEIADAMKSMELRYICTVESAEGFAGTFPELRRKYERRAEIQKMAYQRLRQAYRKQLDKITSRI